MMKLVYFVKSLSFPCFSLNFKYSLNWQSICLCKKLIFSEIISIVTITLNYLLFLEGAQCFSNGNKIEKFASPRAARYDRRGPNPEQLG